MNFKKGFIFVFLSLGWVLFSQGNQVLGQGTLNAPTSNETAGVNSPIRNSGRVLQFYFAPSQFSTVSAPIQFTGLRFRLAALPGNAGLVAPASWPPSEIVFDRYEVSLSRASASVRSQGEFPSEGIPFSDNLETGSSILVRSGPLTIPAGAFPFTSTDPSTPNAFPSFAIGFTTPYSFVPGQDLVVTIRLSGSNAAAMSAFLASADFSGNGADGLIGLSEQSVTPNHYLDPVSMQFLTTGPLVPVRVNDRVQLQVTGQTLISPTCQGYSNDLILDALLSNIGPDPLLNPFFQILELREANGTPPSTPFRLLSAAGASCESGGLVGAIQPVSTSPLSLAPGQFAPVQFRIAIPSPRRFRFFVEVFATIGGSGSKSRTPQKLGKLAIEVQTSKKRTRPIVSTRFIPDRDAPTTLTLPSEGFARVGR